MVEPPVMAKASVSPSASEAESVPERFAVVVSDELSVSVIDPAVGVERRGASLAPEMLTV